MAAAEGQDDNLTDDDLQSEIELVGDLVVGATSSDGPLAQGEIDRLLGVHPGRDEAKASTNQLNPKTEANPAPGAETEADR